jgi:cold shock CspA family protein
VAFKGHQARSNETTGKDNPMRLNGTVKFFNYSRGFGFISPENGEKDVFVHTSALAHSGVSALKEGDTPLRSRTTRADAANRPQKSSSPSRLSPELIAQDKSNILEVRNKWRPAEAGRHS